MTMPKFEPVAFFPQNIALGIQANVNQPRGTKLFTESQLQQAYEAGKRDSVPEGFTLVAIDRLTSFPEINPNNYDHDDVCNLNAWGVELVLAAAPKGGKE